MHIETGVIRSLQADGTESAFGHHELARLGFVHAERTARFLASDCLAALSPDLVRFAGGVPDPDEAIIALLRLCEAANEAGLEQRFAAVLRNESEAQALLSLLGTSVAHGDFLTRHPERVQWILNNSLPSDDLAATYRTHILEAIGADPSDTVPVASATDAARDALRIAYWELLTCIALHDVSLAAPAAEQPLISRHISALAGAALEGALALARARVAGHEDVLLTVIAMGKTGARELNYISDVDVMYVVAPAREEVSADTVTQIGSALARELARICSERTAEGALWQVDANLRPEGKDGELVRTIESFRRYYTKWAHSWEFQALLKARPVAGDLALGTQFLELTDPLVWQASTRAGFVDDTRAMRRRVVSLLPASEAEGNLKLGSGGLRDVEFTVQLLQMIHGRSDESIRVRSTHDAITALAAGGYVGRKQAEELDLAYRTLRSLEHRIQLHRMRRSHMIPTAPSDIRRLARAMRMKPDTFSAEIDKIRRRVRQLHEEIYYRPLLATSASLSDGQIMLSADAQRERLEAIGYRDPARALQHIAALTKGLSRASSIQRQLLPGFLEWFARGVDPDLGLLSFRRLSEALASTHWFLGVLRDSGVAAGRLTRILSSSRYVGEQLERMPHAARWLSNDAELAPLSAQQIREELQATVRRATREEQVIESLRDVRNREVLRIALAHLTNTADVSTVGAALTDLATAILDLAVESAGRLVAATHNSERVGIDFAIIAMGSFGAGEMGYSSDADVQFVATDAGAGDDTVSRGIEVASLLQRILNAPASGMDMKLNADLRPEGRSGPLVRSFDSFRDYYRSHAERWEKQALLRAKACVGPERLIQAITAELDHARYPAEGLSTQAGRDLARMKARIEGERLPRGAKPTHHLKLGRGATTDVEWVVQKLLIQHAHAYPEIRVTHTLQALKLFEEHRILSHDDAHSLSQAWKLAWQLRRALFLSKGRETDVLPHDVGELRALAALVNADATTGRELEERYLKLTRHARTITEREIFGE